MFRVGYFSLGKFRLRETFLLKDVLFGIELTDFDVRLIKRVAKQLRVCVHSRDYVHLSGFKTILFSCEYVRTL